MLKRLHLFTLLIFSTLVFAQVCPQGSKWNPRAKTCVKVDLEDYMKIVNYNCPKGYSYVSFKNECLTNLRVREIYDSLRVEYLKDPEVQSSTAKNISNSDIEDIIEKNSTAKKGKETEVVTQIVEVPVTRNLNSDIQNDASMEALLREIEILKQEISAIKGEVSNVTSVVATMNTEVSNVNTRLESMSTEVANVNTEVANVNNKLENMTTNMTNMNTEVANMNNKLENLNTEVNNVKEDVSDLQSNSSNIPIAVQQNAAQMEIGKQNTSVARTDIYGMEEAQFNIECPDGFRWIESESICLRQAIYLERAQLKLKDPNAQLDYGIKDVKCPKGFRWNEPTANCIPTLHALQD